MFSFCSNVKGKLTKLKLKCIIIIKLSQQVHTHSWKFHMCPTFCSVLCHSTINSRIYSIQASGTVIQPA